MSRSFPIKQGVREGALLSPLFYSIFINDLLVELKKQELGVSIGPIYSGVLAYVDDIFYGHPAGDN